MIHNSLKDDLDVKKQLQKFNTVGNVVIRKFGVCSNEVKRIIFRAHCSSVYCGYLWTEYNAMSLKKLRVCHNDILRRLTGISRWSSATAMFASEHLDNLDVILRKLSCRFRSRIQDSDNCILKAIYESNYFMNSRLYTKWHLRVDVSR